MVLKEHFGFGPCCRTHRSRRIISLLIRAAKYELATHTLYTRLWRNGQNPELPDLSGVTLKAAAEDWTHYSDLMNRARFLAPAADLHDYAGTSREAASIPPRSVLPLLRGLQATERYLVYSYREICRLTIEFDYRTFDLSFRNLTDNQSHDERLRSLLMPGPHKMVRSG